jgi:demethylmenaquinone methyltransferase/2-methoxy-6-polyprenyl-1,4-benzoquinol methylase
LPRLIEQSRWLAELQQALARNDFADVKVDYQTLYGSAIVTAIKR